MTAEIVVSEFMDQGEVDGLARDFSLHYDPVLVDRPEDLRRALTGARALIVRNRTQVDQALLEAGPKLEAVGRLGVGLDNIDLEGCAARGIAVCPATGANAIAVAEYVMATALMLLRGTFCKNRDMVAGAWPREAGMGREAAGKTLGSVGFGSIGQQVAKHAQALGLAVTACDPHLPEDHPAWDAVQRLDFESVVSQSDIVTLHVPLNEATRHLIGKPEIAGMKPGAILINTARGGIVDETAVVAALRAGHLAGAALDVFESEPLDAKAGKRFADVPNLVLTPHIAGITEESNPRVARVVAEKIRAVLEAKP